MKLFLDMTRVAYRLTGSTPTGIDRVEFAYASRVLRTATSFEPVGVFTSPFFTGALRRDLMLEVLQRIEQAWRLRTPATEDAVYGALRSYLATPIGDGGAIQRRFRDKARFQRLRQNMIYPVRDIIRSPTRLRRRLSRFAGQTLVYLNTSHNQLDTPNRLSWASDAKASSVFFIHDTIPIDYPEFVAPSSSARHQRRLATVARMAALVIVNSEATRRHLQSYLLKSGGSTPTIKVLGLGVADAFLAHRTQSAPPSEAPPLGHPYFVTLSTIEPRKNLLFLLAVWRRLVERHGARAPRLVVVGARGWENENIVDVLERSRALGGHLVEASDLCDAGLAALMSGARALLQPSLIEGFGLPIIEGLTLGLPVVASDIAAHREVGGDLVTYLDPIDGPGWIETIEDLTAPGSERSRKMAIATRTYRPLDWGGHVDAALDMVQAMPSSSHATT